MNKTQNLKRIDGMITAIKSSYATVQAAVQEAAVAIVEHANEHGDCTRALKLVRAIPARERNSLVGYFMLVSPIGVLLGKTAKDDKVRFIKEDSPKHNPFNMDKARALNWFDDPANVNPPADPITLFSGGVYDAVLATLKRMAEGKVGKDKEASEEALITAQELFEAVTEMRAKKMAALAASDTANDDEGDEPAAKEVVNG